MPQGPLATLYKLTYLKDVQGIFDLLERSHIHSASKLKDWLRCSWHGKTLPDCRNIQPQPLTIERTKIVKGKYKII